MADVLVTQLQSVLDGVLAVVANLDVRLTLIEDLLELDRGSDVVDIPGIAEAKGETS